MIPQDAHNYLCFKGYKVTPPYAKGIKEYYISKGGSVATVSTRDMVALATMISNSNLARGLAAGFGHDDSDQIEK